MSSSSFAKSTFILSIAALLSKILGSIFRIPLQNIAGDEVLGIFSLVYPVYMVALILSVAGIPIAISKLIAAARADGDLGKVKQIYQTASILAILFGLISFTLVYSFSGPLSEALGGPGTRLALIVVAATLLVAPYMAVYRGFFQGFDSMTPTAISQVMEQFVRVGLILLAAYYLASRDYANEIVAGGVMIGSIMGAIASLIYLRITFQKSDITLPDAGTYSAATFKKWSKQILRVSIPIAFGTITMALLNVVDSFTVSYGLKTAGANAENINYLYGIYGRGLALVQIATVFATSVVLPLIPLITKKLAEHDTTGTREIVERTHRMTHLLSWPAAFGLFALTLPLNLALFTNLEGSLVLAVIGLSSVFTSFAVLGTGILQGMNSADRAAVIILAIVVLKTVLNIFLINLYGLEGAAFSTLVIYLLLFLLNSYFIYKRLPFTLWNKTAGKVMAASMVMGVAIGIPTLFFDWENWSRPEATGYVLAAVLVGGLLYSGLLMLLKVLDKQAMQQLPVIGKRIKRRSHQ